MIGELTWESWQKRMMYARKVGEQLACLEEKDSKTVLRLNDICMMINMTQESINKATKEQGSSHHFTWAEERSSALYSEAKYISEKYLEKKISAQTK